MSSADEIINPNEHLQIPTWINADYFLTNVLKNDEPNYSKILNFRPIAAIPPGENFTSIMVRIHMDLEMCDGSNKHKTYVLKTMLDADKGGSMINELGLFDKELIMYRRYLPAFEALYKSAGRPIQLSPKCLFIDESRPGMVNFIFEDLKTQNYQNVDRVQGFDMVHMRRALEKLAELHAASAVYAERNGAYLPEFLNGFITKDKSFSMQQRMFQVKPVDYKRAMAMWGIDDAELYIRKFPTFEQYWECCLRTLDVDNNAFNVLLHGDFWSSNIMLNYLPNGNVKDMLFCDYQLCKWGSPAEDLLFFISISAAKDIRIKEFDNFIAIYHEHLIECLKLLGYKKRLPKLRELHMDLYRENTTFYAFFAVFNHLVSVLLPTDKDSNLHSLMRDDEFGQQFRMAAYTNPIYVEAMKDLFPFFRKRGLFNFEDYDQRE